MNQFIRALVLCACVLAVSCGEAQQQQDNSNSTLTKMQLRFRNENLAKKQDDGPLALIGKLFKFFEVAKKEEESEKRQEQVFDEKSSNSTRRKRQAYGYGGGYGAPAPGGYGAPAPGGYGAPAPGGYGAPAPGGYGAPGYGGGYGPAPSDYQFDDFYTNDFLYDYYDWVCSEDNCQLCNILTAECCNPTVNPNCILPDSCLNNPCLSGGTCVPTRTLVGALPDFICVCLPGFTGKYCQLTNEYLLPPFDDDDDGYGGYQQPQAPSYGGYQQQQAPSYGGYQQQQAQPNYGRPPYQAAPAPQYQAAPAPSYGQAAPAPQYQAAPAPSYGQAAPAPQYQAPVPQYQAAPAPQYQAAPAPQYQAAPAPQYQAPAPQRAAPVPVPQYQQAPAPQRSAPGPAAYGAQGQVRTLSAKATNWEGFDCNCQGKGYCAQVGTEENSEPEFFCICNDNTYGSRCDEGFRNPCADNTLKARFAPIDRQVPGYYFIECKTSLPYVRKCENGKRFNPKTNMCQQVKQRSAARPQGLMQQQQQQQ